MIVRLAYLDRDVAVCRAHYEAPTPTMPALGPVQDATDRASIGRCIGCDEVEPCDHPRMNGATCTECDETCTGCGPDLSQDINDDCPIHGSVSA